MMKITTWISCIIVGLFLLFHIKNHKWHWVDKILYSFMAVEFGFLTFEVVYLIGNYLSPHPFPLPLTLVTIYLSTISVIPILILVKWFSRKNSFNLLNPQNYAIALLNIGLWFVWFFVFDLLDVYYVNAIVKGFFIFSVGFMLIPKEGCVP